jgi:hypothetical protein
LPSIIATRSRPLEARERAGGHEPAVAQHGHLVADRVELVEAVADVHDAHARRAQPAHHVVEERDLAVGERARGLVEHQHARAERDAARDGHHLLARGVEGAERGARVDVQPSAPSARAASARTARQSITPHRRGSRPRQMFSATVR